MLIKNIFLPIILFIIPHIVFSEDIYFKVIETTPAWEDNNFPRPSNVSGEILKGSIVKGYTGVEFSSFEGELENILLQRIFYENKKITIYANSVIPLETQDLFDVNILYNPEKPLVSSVSMSALQSNNRELFYLNDKTGWDVFLAFQDWSKESIHYGTGDWLMQYVSAETESMQITQTTLNLSSGNKSDLCLLIKYIKKTENTYIVTVKGAPYFQDTNRWWKLPVPEERELFTVILVPDGDYINLYLENKNFLIDTFVFVNKETVIQINNLIRGLPIDLTGISLPRRADGSVDYPPVLSPITVEEGKIPQHIIDTESQTVGNNTEANSLPLWAWGAIIGGTVIVVGSVIVFIVKQKK